MALRLPESVLRILLVLASVVGTALIVELGVRLTLAFNGPTALDHQLALEQSSSQQIETDARNDSSEISLKGLVTASAHHDVVYQLKPRLQGTFLGKTIATNSFGFRDRHYAVEAPAHTYRIVGLGDSVMFGWGVDQHEPFLEVLEDRLAERATGTKTYEVLNFGVPGYNTAMEVATLEHRALVFEPDLVVLDFVGNDLKLPHFLQRPRDLWSLRRWYSMDLVSMRLDLVARYREQQLLPHDLRSMDPVEVERVRDQYRHMEGEAGFERAIDKLSQLSRAHGFRVIVVIPAANAHPFTLAAEAARAVGFDVVETVSYFGNFLAVNNLDTDRQTWSDTFWLSARDHHPNARAHQLLADALYDKLVELEIIPSPAASPKRSDVARD